MVVSVVSGPLSVGKTQDADAHLQVDLLFTIYGEHFAIAT